MKKCATSTTLARTTKISYARSVRIIRSATNRPVGQEKFAGAFTTRRTASYERRAMGLRCLILSECTQELVEAGNPRTHPWTTHTPSRLYCSPFKSQHLRYSQLAPYRPQRAQSRRTRRATQPKSRRHRPWAKPHTMNLYATPLNNTRNSETEAAFFLRKARHSLPLLQPSVSS